MEESFEANVFEEIVSPGNGYEGRDGDFGEGMKSSLVDGDHMEGETFKKRGFKSKTLREIGNFFNVKTRFQSSRVKNEKKLIARKDVMEFGDDNTPMNVRRLMKDADLGDREARFTLGYYFDVGAGGVEPNTEEAIHYYQLAAMDGHEIAQNNIGVLYSTGHRGRIAKNAPEALHWYKKAAVQFHNASAQFHCGLAYMNGEGLDEKDDAIAFQYFKMAAKQGHLLSQSNVGAMYMGGRGINTNYYKARKWLLKAAAMEDAVALHNLGVIYSAGYGVDPNMSLSYEYFARSMGGRNRTMISDELHQATKGKNGTLYNS